EDATCPPNTPVELRTPVRAAVYGQGAHATTPRCRRSSFGGGARRSSVPTGCYAALASHWNHRRTLHVDTSAALTFGGTVPFVVKQMAPEKSIANPRLPVLASTAGVAA